MDWPNLLSTGGGWGVALFVAFAVWRGDLVLRREIESEKAKLSEAMTEAREAVTRMEAMQTAERQQKDAIIAQLQQQVTEARKAGSP